MDNEHQESRLKQHAKSLARQQGKKIGKKLIKKGAKIVARAALSGIKALIAFLVSLGGPFLLGAVAVLLAIFGIYLAITLMFTTDSSILEDGPEKELYEYIQQQSDATVDMSKPEQIPYKVPAELIVSALQIYDSTKHGKSEKAVVKLIAQKLKPTFVYYDKKGNIETIITSCTTKDGKKNCTTSTQNTPFELNLLEKVEAWDRIQIATFEKTITDWAHANNESTSPDKKGNITVTSTDVKSRATTYSSTDDIKIDYSYYDRILSDAPFDYKENDKKTVEALYQATGNTIQYSEWLNGDSLVAGGFDNVGGFNSDVNVTPGASVPAEYMKYYLAGQTKFGVDWYYLAAIHKVETQFSTIDIMVSSVGAVGHMQFMPCTWLGWNYQGCGGLGNLSSGKEILTNVAFIKQYGGYGVDADGDGKADPWNMADAIMSAAKYLAANGFKNNIDKAVRRYNHSDIYVADVKRYAAQYKAEATYTGSGVGDKLIASGPGNVPMKPTTGTVRSSYTVRDMGDGAQFHYGIDIANSLSTPIVAVTDGVVTVARGGCAVYGYYGSTCGGGWGNYLWVKHNIEGTTYELVYAHLQSYAVSPGQPVKKGQVIGKMGSSGSSTGPHLHVETHKGARISNQNVLNPMLVLPLGK
ncbi:peptidoglycan DD-metalloendopeptidase family protein [Viridibacillus arvi]|uniref:peptidoglycan DD-metalloendopeptidase family protein n=1 Tax=Viridibacillus arvi TaxID=263475 RepID=UPI003D2E3429